jgi:hypothetical protein
MRWPLEPLLDAAAGPARPSLGAMRADFARFLSTRFRPNLVTLGPVIWNPGPQADRVTTPASRVTPHPSTLDTLSLDEAAELTGRSRSAIRRAIADGRLAAAPPATDHPAGYGSGFRLSRIAVEALFAPTPEARASLHVCGRECDPPLHVSYLAAQVANRDGAERFLRQTFHIGALVVEACLLATVPLHGLARMTTFYVRGASSIPPDRAWQSSRVAWRNAGPNSGGPHLSGPRQT